MRFLFIIQGEGRGHMTQAIALAQLLDKMGHQLSAVCIGTSIRRSIPDFVKNAFTVPLHQFESPNFITDKKQKGIKIGKTITNNLVKTKDFISSMEKIHALVTEHEPDIILNFYDILGGLYNFLYRPKGQFWVIGHQYLSEHRSFVFAKGFRIQKYLFNLNTQVTALGANKKLALSFRPLEDEQKKKIVVLPPLLREDLKNLATQDGDFYLTYMVNHGYSEEVMNFAQRNPEIKIEAFWDKKEAGKEFKALDNLTFHQVDDRLFLEKMATCKGLVSTAGFESICEAMYLGKPVMFIPVQGQYEQLCNALDAEISGAGVQHTHFDFKYFDGILETRNFGTDQAKNWIDSFPFIFQRQIEQSYGTRFNSAYWEQTITSSVPNS